MKDDRSSGYVYVSAVVGTGFLVVCQSLWQLSAQRPGAEWFMLAALTLLTGSFTVKLPALAATLSVSETFVFTSVLLFGPAAGTITVVLDALVMLLWSKSAKRSPLKLLFNATAPAIAIRIASEAFFMMSGAHAGHIDRQDVGHLIIPVFAFALLYFAINTGLVAGALSVERGLPVVDIWLKNFPPVSINYFVGSSIAILIVAYTNQIDITVLSIIVPLLLISYLTFRTSMGRLEDASRHVAQVNELYLSTVETLAMAVDAKDQITHGHIRRVEVYALELAKLLGVKDEEQLKAIEAAALLHDLGKLAIPEHILNKPGRLTGPEFEKMKRHADIGADLLFAVKFPYPVVPIVRHHHEQWDGNGYPTGISGTDIPLGARILSVVDCFDALTSDRPYRPRLTTTDAFATILQGRGSLYDPLVVDTFIKAYPQIAPAAMRAGQEASGLLSVSGFSDQRAGASTTPLEQIRITATETSLLDEYRRRVGTARSSDEALSIAGHCLRQLTAATVCAFYRYDKELDILACENSIGDTLGLIEGLSIVVGTRVTGWAAATRRTSLNADASLDLAELATHYSPPLRSTLSVPMTNGEQLVGVFTAYANRENAFRESDRYVFEQIVADFQLQLSRVSRRSSGVVVFPLQKR